MTFKLDEDTAILVAVGVATILVLATVVYTALIPRPMEHFTELYILGPNHMADDIPDNISRGQFVKLYLGVKNHMGHVVYARVTVNIGNQTITPEEPYLPSYNLTEFKRFVQNEEVWEFPLYLTIDEVEVSGDYTFIRGLTINGISLRGLNISTLHGYNYRFVFKLYLYGQDDFVFTYPSDDGLAQVWLQFWFNVTLT